MLMQTEALTRKALDPVALMRSFNMFFSDCQTDAGMPQLIQAAENSDLRRTGPLWLLEDESKMIGS